MPRSRPPLWLRTPGRFGGLTPRVARWWLLALAAMLGWCLTAIAAPDPVAPTDAGGTGGSPVVLYGSIVEGMRAGGDYYGVTAASLRQAGDALKPAVTFRLPALAMAEAALPPWLVTTLLYLLIAAVVLAWHVRLHPALARPTPRWLALALLAGGLVVQFGPDYNAFHELWAGLLIALSLALRREDRWVEAVAIGLIAMLIRETAALYVAVMLAMALLEGRRREAIGWTVGLVVLAAVIALHAHAVAQVVRDSDGVAPGWTGLLGFGFFVKSIAATTALAVLPGWIAALLVGLAMFGWAVWDNSLALRMLVTLWGYAGLIGIAGHVDGLGGLMVAPVLLVGLAFVPDGLRDLVSGALDRRRIVVTRRVS